MKWLSFIDSSKTAWYLERSNSKLYWITSSGLTKVMISMLSLFEYITLS